MPQSLYDAALYLDLRESGAVPDETVRFDRPKAQTAALQLISGRG